MNQSTYSSYYAPTPHQNTGQRANDKRNLYNNNNQALYRYPSYTTQFYNSNDDVNSCLKAFSYFPLPKSWSVFDRGICGLTFTIGFIILIIITISFTPLYQEAIKMNKNTTLLSESPSSFSIDVNNGFQLNIPSLTLLLLTPETNRTTNQTQVLFQFMSNLTNQLNNKTKLKLNSNLDKIYNLRLIPNSDNLINVSYSIKTNPIKKIDADEMKFKLDKALSDSRLYDDIKPNILNSAIVINAVRDHIVSNLTQGEFSVKLLKMENNLISFVNNVFDQDQSGSSSGENKRHHGKKHSHSGSHERHSHSREPHGHQKHNHESHKHEKHNHGSHSNSHSHERSKNLTIINEANELKNSILLAPKEVLNNNPEQNEMNYMNEPNDNENYNENNYSADEESNNNEMNNNYDDNNQNDYNDNMMNYANENYQNNLKNNDYNYNNNYVEGPVRNPVYMQQNQDYVPQNYPPSHVPPSNYPKSSPKHTSKISTTAYLTPAAAYKTEYSTTGRIYLTPDKTATYKHTSTTYKTNSHGN